MSYHKGYMGSFTCKVDNQGRITLPVEWRKSHSIEPGNEVFVFLTEDHLEILTATQSIEEACRMVAKYGKGKPALALLHEERQKQIKRQQSLEDALG